MDDLNNLKLLNAKLAKEGADHKNAKEEFRETLAKINRMLGGAGWTHPGDVLNALHSYLNANSSNAKVELEQQLLQSEAVVTGLRQQLDLERTKAEGLQATVKDLRRDLVQREQDKRLLFEENKRLSKQLEDLRKQPVPVQNVAAPLKPAASEQGAIKTLEHLLNMEREDHAQQMGAFQAALADAFDELEAIKLPTDNKSRATKHYQNGIRVGGKLVLAHLQHVFVILNKEQDNGRGSERSPSTREPGPGSRTALHTEQQGRAVAANGHNHELV